MVKRALEQDVANAGQPAKQITALPLPIPVSALTETVAPVKPVVKPLPRAPTRVTPTVRIRDLVQKPGSVCYNKVMVECRVIQAFHFNPQQKRWYSGMPIDSTFQVYVTFVVTSVPKAEQDGRIALPNPLFCRTLDKVTAEIPGVHCLIDVAPGMLLTVCYNHSMNPAIPALRLPDYIHRDGIGCNVRLIDIYPKVVMNEMSLGSPELAAVFKNLLPMKGPGYFNSNITNVTQYALSDIFHIGALVNVFWNLQRDNIVYLGGSGMKDSHDLQTVCTKLMSIENPNLASYLDQSFRSGTKHLYLLCGEHHVTEMNNMMENSVPGLYAYSRVSSDETTARMKSLDPSLPDVTQIKFGLGVSLRLYSKVGEPTDYHVQMQVLHGSVLNGFGVDSGSAYNSVIHPELVAGHIPVIVTGTPNLAIMEKNPVPSGFDGSVGIEVDAIVINFRAWLATRAIQIEPSAAGTLTRQHTPVTAIVEYQCGGSFYMKPSDKGDAAKGIKPKIDPTVADGTYFERFPKGNVRCFPFMGFEDRVRLLEHPEGYEFYYIPGQYGQRVLRHSLGLGETAYHPMIPAPCTYDHLASLFSKAVTDDNTDLEADESMPTVDGLVYVVKVCMSYTIDKLYNRDYLVSLAGSL